MSELVEIPAKTNPLGIKGIGEAGTIAAPPTVVNAVLDALRELGVDHLDMPLTPARIWQAAKQAANGTSKSRLAVSSLSNQASNRATRRQPVIREHKIPTPDCKPYIAVEGPDRNLWFCENGAAKIGCFDPRTRTPGANFPCRTAGSMPVGIVVGGDENLWFTEKEGNRIGRISVDGEIAEFAMPSANAGPDGIALGPDGNVWFSESEADEIARITATGGSSNSAPALRLGASRCPSSSRRSALVQRSRRRSRRPDYDVGRSHRISVAESGQRAARHGAASRRQHMVRRNRRQRNRSYGGRTAAIVEFEVPTPDASVRGIAITPDGDVWFTENFANKIGRIDADGAVIGEYAIPTPKSGARCIVAMADGRLFFTQYDAGMIGEIRSVSNYEIGI